MKILLGVPEYPPYHIGGGGEVFKNLAENYKKLGHDVVVIYGYYPTKSWSEKIKKYKDKNGIVFYQVPEIPYPKSMPYLRTVMPCNLGSWLKLKKIIKREKPDVAHLHGYGFIFVNQLAQVIKNLKIKYLYTLHGAPVSPEKIKGVILFFYSIYRKSIGVFTLNRARWISAVSKYTKSFPEFIEYKKSIKIINNGLDVERYFKLKNAYNPDIFSSFLKGTGRNVIFLSLGRIEWLKGFQYFIKIMPDLIDMGHNVKYFIAGIDNGYKDILERSIKANKLRDRVFFIGQLNFKEKIAAINQCDYVIVSSVVENYPAVPLEALALKKITIANDVGGIPEILNDKKNGIVVDMKSRKQFLLRVNNILSRNNTRRIIFKNIETTKISDWRDVAAQYLDIFCD